MGHLTHMEVKYCWDFILWNSVDLILDTKLKPISTISETNLLWSFLIGNVKKTVESSRGSSKGILEEISEQNIRKKSLSNVQNLNP